MDDILHVPEESLSLAFLCEHLPEFPGPGAGAEIAVPIGGCIPFCQPFPREPLCESVIKIFSLAVPDGNAHDPIEESGPGVCGALCHFPDILFRVFQKRKERRHDDACVQSLICHGADRRKPLRRGRDARLDLFAESVVSRGNGHHT